MASAVMCLLAGMPAQADEPRVAGSAAAGRDLPAAFLEFLGEGEDQQGDWQDPLVFDDPEWRSLDDDVEWQYDKD